MGHLSALKKMRHMPCFLAVLLLWFLRLVACTYRVRIADPAGALPRILTDSFVLSLWHNRILFTPALISRRYLERVAVLISASRDGGYISAIVRRLGLQVVRGSSSRGAAGALLGLHRKLADGNSVLLTVDGPRGPRYCIHQGAVALARQCGVPLLPLALNARHYWQLRSWDGMQIPWPFSTVTLRFGTPFAVGPDEDIPAAAERLREAMLAITEDRA